MKKKRTYKSYSGEFKLNALKMMKEEGLSQNETARRLGIPNSGRLTSWKRIYDAEGEAGLLRERRGGDHRSHKREAE